VGKNITEILWTSTAKKDLREIFEYLVQFSEDAAFRIINKIVDKAEILRGDSPEIGQREPLLSHKPVGYRYLVEGNYKIIYSIRVNKVVIHTVFDARQNPKKMEDKVT
jgi:addiction module RelE/StbE family toxin